MMPKEHNQQLLVIGARPDSVGEAVAQTARKWGIPTATAGINGEEYKLDISVGDSISRVLTDVNPTNVVCTVGVNEPMQVRDNFLQSKMTDSFRTNVIGPMEVLRKFVDSCGELPGSFVILSSNSARIPRSGSIAYCASKAALSMAVRCAGRDLARAGSRVKVWGYEPGLLDTANTKEIATHFPDRKLHRMEGVGNQGLSPWDLADRIIGDVTLGGEGLNGCLIPFDAGEV